MGLGIWPADSEGNPWDGPKAAQPAPMPFCTVATIPALWVFSGFHDLFEIARPVQHCVDLCGTV